MKFGNLFCEASLSYSSLCSSVHLRNYESWIIMIYLQSAETSFPGFDLSQLFVLLSISFVWKICYVSCLQMPFHYVQGVVLDILVGLGIIRSHHFWLDVEHIEEALQNVLVCLEMVVFSVLQQYAYHVSPYSGEVETKLKLNKKD